MHLSLNALIAGAIVLLDQISKHLLKNANRVLLPGLLRLSGTRNTGAAFSLFAGKPWLISLLTVSTALAVLVYIILARPRGLTGLGLALVLGGALGNLIDRLFLGYVIDFIELNFIRFPIFNIADIAVVSGSILTASSIIFTREEAHE